MADAFANSVMVDALIRGREGTTVPEQPAVYYAPALPTLDQPSALERWEPWVRAYTALGELMRGIDFSAPGSGNFRVSYALPGATGTISTMDRPSRNTFKRQLELVMSWAELRNERATEIMAQIDPQYAFWSSVVYLHPTRTPRTFELINILLQFCVYVEMRFKHALACWRPVEYNAQVQPLITTPGHGAFPSGHSTQAHAVAHVLGKLLKLRTADHLHVVDQLARQAARIATNRVVAGVHFPADSMAGRMLGVALGEYFCARCDSTQQPSDRTFHSTFLDNSPQMDFNPFDTVQELDQAPGGSQLYSLAAPATTSQNIGSPLMQHLWGKAADEWKGMFGHGPVTP